MRVLPVSTKQPFSCSICFLISSSFHPMFGSKYAKLAPYIAYGILKFKGKVYSKLSSTNLSIDGNNCKPDCLSQLSAPADELNTATAQLLQKRGQ